MVRSPAGRARALLTVVAALWALPAGAADPTAWEVTVAVRLSNPGPAPVTVRLALPPSDDRQALGPVTVTARGLKATVERDGPEPHVLLRGKLRSARRVAVRYTVTRRRGAAATPAIAPVEAPPPDLLPYLTPSPLFQSRSILVRDFLETYVSPVLDAPGQHDLVRTIQQVARERLEFAPDARTLTLDVIRNRRGRRIGIERAFTTFLRCAHVPARFVEGINLESKTRHKRVFWTEAWSSDGWWPISASAGWSGRVPRPYVALARDGQRTFIADGASAAYALQVRPLGSGS